MCRFLFRHFFGGLLSWAAKRKSSALRRGTLQVYHLSVGRYQMILLRKQILQISDASFGLLFRSAFH